MRYYFIVNENSWVSRWSKDQISGYEVDLYLPETHQLIQVFQNLNNAPTREREVQTLQDAIKLLKPNDALILMDANGKEFKIDSIPVGIRSAAEWILNPHLQFFLVDKCDQLSVR